MRTLKSNRYALAHSEVAREVEVPPQLGVTRELVLPIDAIGLSCGVGLWAIGAIWVIGRSPGKGG